MSKDVYEASIIICDLDGTLALNNHGRDWFDASDCDKDAVNMPVLRILEMALQDEGNYIVFVSGREEKYRKPTKKFLSRYELPFRGLGRRIYFDEFPLFMRQSGDNRPDYIVKKEIWNNESMGDLIDRPDEILFVLDDRSQVVKMWRELGLTCLQVADGNF